MNLLDFKAQLKIDIKPERRKHYQIGPIDSNSLLTRFRTGRTNLNLNRYTIGQSDDPSCMCHFRQESSEHFYLGLLSLQCGTSVGPSGLHALSRK